ncbi:extracellular solute-binding protein [Paenibacillus hemerocallicola]|uniref:Extracellular solute-binding protein n=2 Tax=Paenibacillus hemerocallicola TaxID=1172614 RepID=A0A5C4TEA8_9BACL|nr:extracellular solute-binding protein [Paenibacillus hemerocallicola]
MGDVKMNNKQRIRRPLATLLLALTVSACSGGSDGKGADDGGGASSKLQDVTKAPVELTFFTSYSTLMSDLSQEGFMNDFGQYMQKKYPNFSFKPIFGSTTKETIQTIVASKTPIDIIQISPVQTFNFVDLGLSSDISDLIKKYKLDLSHVEPSSLDLLTKAGNNQLVGLPYQMNSLVLFYNKDLFDKFGVPYPKDNMTWNETADIVRRTTRQDGGVQYIGFGNQQGWANILRSNQLSIEPINLATNKVTYENGDWKRLFDQLHPIFQVPGNGINTEAVSMNLFIKERRLSMILSYPEYYQRFPSDLNWDVVTSPQLADRPGVNFAPVPIVLAPVAYSPKRDAAFLAISEMLSEEVQLLRARKYAISSVLTDKKFREQMGAEVPALQGKNRQVMQPVNMAKSITFSPLTSDAMNGIGTAFSDTMSGKKDANTALREQAEAANKKIAEKLEAEGKK